MTDPVGGETITLVVNDRLALDLSEHGSAGYKWQVATTGSALDLAFDTFEAPPSGRIGAAGMRHLAFLARQPGPALIKLRLVRPWRPQATEAEADITVRVVTQ